MVEKVCYEHEALLYAEKYGIIEYEVEGNTMSYYETFNEGRKERTMYNAKVNLDTKKEKRTQVK